MGGCRCSYKSCRSATKTTENLHFFHYPVKHRDRCAVWIKNADKPEFANLPDYQLRNKVICGLHFEDKFFANLEKRRLVHNAIPTLDAGCDSTSDDLAYVKQVEILPSSTDGNTFTLALDDIQAAAKRQKIDYTADILNIAEVTKVEPEVYTIDSSYFNQSFYNNDNVKDVMVINAATAAKENSDDEHIDDEDCMLFDNPTSSASARRGQLSNDKPLQTLFFDNDDEGGAENVQIQDSKGNIMMTNLGPASTNRIATLKSANGTTTMIKKIKMTGNQNLQPITLSTQLNSTGQVVKRVFKKVISAQRPSTSASPLSVSSPVNTPVRASTSAVSPPTASVNLKQTQQLATNTIRLTNKNLLRCLKGRLPDSILGAVSLHLNKRRNAVTVEEQEYESMIVDVPSAGRTALRNFGWCIPSSTAMLK